LTEKFAYEKRVKENKLKVAMMQVRHHCNILLHHFFGFRLLCVFITAPNQAKRSNAEIVEQIEKSAVQKHVQERKRKRENESGVATSAPVREESELEKSKRSFRQQHAIGQDYGEQLFKATPKLISKVFGTNKD